jgi:esterase/lipase superfamily enzyme
MKYRIFLLLTFLSVLALYAQDANKTVIACTYHYTLSSKERGVADNEFQIHYLISVYNKYSSIFFTKKNDFSSAMHEAFAPKNILLFVHGDDIDIENLAIRGADFPELYNVNTILFAWPSYRISHNSIKNYHNSKKNAELSFHCFLQLVDSIKNYSIKNNVKASIIFHSLGNIFAQKYALFLENNPDIQQFFTNIILNSACVPAKGHASWVDILCQKSSNNVYITINKNDKILQLASIFIEHKPTLGRKIGNEKSQNAHYIDFTKELKNISSDKKMPSCHTYFISYPPRENSAIKNFYNRLFNTINVEQ